MSARRLRFGQLADNVADAGCTRFAYRALAWPEGERDQSLRDESLRDESLRDESLRDESLRRDRQRKTQMIARAQLIPTAPRFRRVLPVVLGNLAALPARLRRLAREDRGNVALLIGLTLPVLAALVFLVAESAVFYVEKRRFQAASDAAAISAAMELQRGLRFECFASYGDTCGRQSAMEELARRGLLEGQAGTEISVASPARTGPHVAHQNSVEVEVTREIPSVVGALFFGAGAEGKVRIAARSVSMVQTRESACALALDTSSRAAIDSNPTLPGSLYAYDCAVVANSQHDQAIDLRGVTGYAVQRFWSAGGLRQQARGTEATVTFGPGIQDPYHPISGLSAEEFANLCPAGENATHLTVFSGQVVRPTERCFRSLEIMGGGTLNLDPGIYVVQWLMNARANSVVTGAGVTIIFSRRYDAPLTAIGAKFDAGSFVTLTAPRPEDGQRFTGIVLMFDPASTLPATASTAMTLTGGAEMRLSGAVYAPRNDIAIRNGATTTGNPDCLVLIGRRIFLQTDVRLGIGQCGQLGTLPPELPQVRLVE
ncbi:MAG: hypothetical protein KIT20_13520 [Alphaproteobacteria bacterium]|nr:hypothetical protein [Alphaproteobacteria bacterium]